MDERSIRDIIREEWKKLSGLTWGQRLTYIWDYYKPLMAAILGVIALISLVVTMYQNSQINHLLNVYVINCDSMQVDAEAVTADFEAYIGGIGDKDEILIDTSLTIDAADNSQYGIANQMKLTAVSAAGEMDVVLFDQTQFERYQNSGGLTDLADILSAEQLEAWADDLVYGKDEETGKEIVAGLNVQNAPVIQQYQAYRGEPAYAVVMGNASHLELSATFLEYLMNGI